MKAISIIVFICIAFGVNAQKPVKKTTKVVVVPIHAKAVYTPPIDYTGIESTKASRDALESGTKQSGFCLNIISNACGSVLPQRLKLPVTPVDVMVRHYFGLSYWD
jgi:hypothetical protein